YSGARLSPSPRSAGPPTAQSRLVPGPLTNRQQPPSCVDGGPLTRVHPCRGRGPQGGLTVMLTVLTTWISERIITVTAVTVLTVAAVPTTLVIASHDDNNTI